MNLKDYATEYLERKGTVDRWKASTKITYAHLCRQWIVPVLGEKEVQDIRSRDFDLLVGKMLAKDLSTRRINMVIILLNSVIDDAFVNQVRASKIDYKIKKAKNVDEDEEIVASGDPFSREEVDLILKSASDHWRPFFTCLAFTGARPNEMLGLRWTDINFETREISIVLGKVCGEVARTKTYNRRTIPMIGPVYKTLKALHEESSEDQKEVFVSRHAKFQPGGYLETPGGYRPLDGGHLCRPWTLILERAGVRHRPMYNLRHSFAMNSLRGGVPLPAISKMLGHKSIKTTIDWYLKTCTLEKDDIGILKEVFSKKALLEAQA